MLHYFNSAWGSSVVWRSLECAAGAGPRLAMGALWWRETAEGLARTDAGPKAADQLDAEAA